MYPDQSELAAHDLSVTETATIRARGAEQCAFCGVPAIDARSSENVQLAWFAQHFGSAERAVESQGATSEGEHVWYDAVPDFRERLRGAVWDSQLEPTIPVPEELLARVSARLSEGARAFAEDQFVFAICGRCRHARVEQAEFTSDRMLERYVRAYFDGNKAVAELQPSWSQAQELTSIIAAEVAEFFRETA